MDSHCNVAHAGAVTGCCGRGVEVHYLATLLPVQSTSSCLTCVRLLRGARPACDTFAGQHRGAAALALPCPTALATATFLTPAPPGPPPARPHPRAASGARRGQLAAALARAAQVDPAPARGALLPAVALGDLRLGRLGPLALALAALLVRARRGRLLQVGQLARRRRDLYGMLCRVPSPFSKLSSPCKHHPTCLLNAPSGPALSTPSSRRSATHL